MTSILKVELFRLKKSTAFWLCLGLCVGLPLISMLFLVAVDTLVKSFGDSGLIVELMGEAGGALSMTQEFVAYSADNNVLALIASAVVLATEFSHGTVRNMIVANKKRSDIFLAYYIVALMIGAFYLLAQLAALLLFFGPVFGFGDLGAGQAITALLCQFAMGLTAMLCVQTMVCMFLFATRKTSLTILLPILVVMLVPDIISSIIALVLAALSQNYNIAPEALQCIPFYNWQTLDVLHPAGLNVGMVCLYNLLLAGVFFLIGMSTFRKTDLK